MKTFAYIIAGIFFFLATADAQVDSSATRSRSETPKQLRKRGSGDAVELKGFVDADNDGIDDRLRTESDGRDGKGQRQRRRQRDRFIDLDGDGINDARCSGIGIKRGAKRSRGGGK